MKRYDIKRQRIPGRIGILWLNHSIDSFGGKSKVLAFFDFIENTPKNQRKTAGAKTI